MARHRAFSLSSAARRPPALPLSGHSRPRELRPADPDLIMCRKQPGTAIGALAMYRSRGGACCLRARRRPWTAGAAGTMQSLAAALSPVRPAAITPTLPRRPLVRKVRRQVRRVRLVRAAAHARARVRRVQLWLVPGPLRHVRRHRRLGRLLLPRVCAAGEGRAWGGGAGAGRVCHAPGVATHMWARVHQLTHAPSSLSARRVSEGRQHRGKQGGQVLSGASLAGAPPRLRAHSLSRLSLPLPQAKKYAGVKER